jgi:hypothetical protein
VTHAHFAEAVRFAFESAWVIPAFFATLRLLALRALVIAAFFPATLFFLFAGRCFFVAAAFFARLFAISVLHN